MINCDEKIQNGKEWIDIPPRLRAFYNELDALCHKYNFSISHQDHCGLFIIENYHSENMRKLREADVHASLEDPDFDWMDE